MNKLQNDMAMQEAGNAITDYRCVNCMAVLRNRGPKLYCDGCGRCFPIVSDIPILTSRPRELLMVHLQEFRQALAALEKKRDLLSASAQSSMVPGMSERAERMLQGLTRNFGLIGRFIKPIEEYLNRTANQPSSLIDWALAQSAGSAPQIMLPFFYQDWSRTKDFEDAESLIVSALMDHRPDDEAAAVLGAGACGIVHASAKHFRVVHGVDLSVPTLLVAQAVLSGNPIEVSVPLAGWRSVRLTPPAPVKNEIRLLAGDVGALPFAAGSLSAVVTQYMMDIAGDPLGAAAEIHRVLKPGGIWVNFSNPFKLPGDPPELGLPEPSELPGLFEPLGLDMIKVERTRFTLQNLDQIYAGGHRNAQEVHFFVARKSTRPRETGIQQFQIWDRSADQSWWRRIPRIIPGREIQIIQKRVFGPRGIEDLVEIGLNAVNFSVSTEHTAFVEALFGQFDGQRTLREILNSLASQGLPLSEMEFRELIHCLLNQYCVISLDDTSS